MISAPVLIPPTPRTEGPRRRREERGKGSRCDDAGGQRDRRHRTRGNRSRAAPGVAGHRWSSWTRAVIKRRVAGLGVSLLPLGLLLAAASGMHAAVKALLVKLVSLLAAYGALAGIWQHGFGSQVIWGIPKTGVVVDFVPMMLYAFLFGVSMDCEVFIVSRIKEAHAAGMSTDEAPAEGLGRTGPLVTSAALILFFAFSALGAGLQIPVEIFATGMAAGILVDATVIRALIVPTTVARLGERAWGTPGRGSFERRIAGDWPRQEAQGRASA